MPPRKPSSRDDDTQHGEFDSPEFWRWQGKVDGELRSHGTQLTNINGDVRAIKGEMSNVNVKLAKLTTQVAMFSTIGGIVGAGAVSALFALLGGD